MGTLFNIPTDQTADKTKALVKVEGTLDRITFHNEDNGYTVAQISTDRASVTVLGNIIRPGVGQNYIFWGNWTNHPQFGSQLSVVRHELIRPVTASAIEKYLGSGMVKGVGPITAKRIVAQFGDRALDIIEQSPDELLKVPGLGKKTLDTIKSIWGEQHTVRKLVIFLQSHGISPTYASKIYQKYEDQAISVIERNPYRLASEIWGIGFKSADRIASSIGIDASDRRRLEAGVIYVVNQSTETGGNVYLTEEELKRECAVILGPYEIGQALHVLKENRSLIFEELNTGSTVERAVYTPSQYHAERQLASRILELIDEPLQVSDAPNLDFPESTLGVTLSEEQREAVRLAQKSRVLVITGGPGVGKTTITKTIVTVLNKNEKTVLLASPTGRAAKRLAEVTGYPATTVHRLLAYDPQSNGFLRNAESPIACDALLIDEASMLDNSLTSALLAAVPNTSQVIFIGDVDQLPSVGAGNVLRDIIDSGVVPVARLTNIYRQAAQSLIVAGAHQINAGKTPRLASPREVDADFVFIEEDNPEVLATKIVAIVTNSLVKRGFAPAETQVLAPMQRGTAGSIALNEHLQAAINSPAPYKPELVRNTRRFRLGDRVIQLRNNYDKKVFNGDIGSISYVDAAKNAINVVFDGREVDFANSELDELSLAYSLSIHKSQGSEFPAVVIALHTQHYTLLQRNLIYTALTRAKKFAVLVGSKRALAMAIRNDNQSTRHTRLKERLRNLT